MQQTVDADATTKDQADVALETILVFGLSYFFCAVAEMVLADVAVAEMTAAYGLSSSYSAVAVSELAEVETTVVAVATMVATNIYLLPGVCLYGRLFTYF